MPDTDRHTLRLAALRLLTRRDYSRQELASRLAGEGADPEALAAVLDELAGEQCLSDQRYARQRVAARSGRYGDQRLKQELRQRGVGDEEIASALAEGPDEVARCLAVWAKKFGERPDSPEKLAKQMRFLQYRGFSSESIRQVLRGVDE